MAAAARKYFANIKKFEQCLTDYVNLENLYLACTDDKQSAEMHRTLRLYNNAFNMINNAMDLVTLIHEDYKSSTVVQSGTSSVLKNNDLSLTKDRATNQNDFPKNVTDKTITDIALPPSLPPSLLPNLANYCPMHMQTVTIMFIKDQFNFYFTESTYSQKLLAICDQEDLQRYLKEPPPNVVFGVTFDGMRTFRGVVVFSGHEKLIYCIDIGMLENYSAAKTFYILDGGMRKLPPQGVPCQLLGIKKADSVIEENIDDFLKDKLFSTFKIEVVSVTEQKLNVYIFDVNFRMSNAVKASIETAEHVESGSMKRVAAIEKDLSDINDKNGTVLFITAFQSPVTFWATKDKASIISFRDEQIMESQQLKYWPNVSQIFLAKRARDNLWYRGLILEKFKTNITVNYIDLGETETISINRLCSLRHSMRMLPPAIQLYKIAGYQANTVDTKDLESKIKMMTDTFNGVKLNVSIQENKAGMEVQFLDGRVQIFLEMLRETGYIVKEQ